MSIPVFTRTAILPLLILCAAGCSPTATDESASTDDRARPAKLHTLLTQETVFRRSYPATLEARLKADLAFRVGGHLQALPARAGAWVRKGDLLASLDSADYQNAVDARRAAYQLAKVQHDQAKKLNTKRLASQLQLDQAIASLKAANAQLKQAKDNFRYTELRAPFDGVIARVDTDNHQAVKAGSTVMLLQGLNQLDIGFSVPESLISRMNRVESPEMLAKVCGAVHFSTHPGESFAACYKEHELVPDQLTRNYKALFSLTEAPSFGTLPGMSATIELDFSAFMADNLEPALVAPLEAVHQQDGNSWVWRLDDQMRAHHVQVQLGTLGDQGFEVLSGLQAGDTIVAAGLGHVRENMLLKPLVKERGL